MNKKKIICITALVESSPQALPLGLACIASYLKHSSLTKDLFDVSIHDFTLEDKLYKENTFNDFIEKFSNCFIDEKEIPFAFLLSVYVWNKPILEKIAFYLKSKFPNSYIIVGGPEITANPFSFKNFDFSVSGEGEEAISLLLNSLYYKKAFSIQGVFSIDDNKISSGRTQLPDLTKLSSPYLDKTLSIEKYNGVLWELARGCPFSCSYCYESKGENKIRFFPKERLENELVFFAKNNVSQVFVLDPTYNANKSRAIELINLIKKYCPETFFYFEARGEFIDYKLAQAFASINCSLQFGLQSSNPEVLAKVNRKFDKKLFSKNISILNQVGITFGLDLIYGLPSDNYSGFKKSIDYALSLYPNNLEMFRLSILPGTQLFEDAKKYNLLFEKESPYHIIESPDFSKEDLNKAEVLSKTIDCFYNKGRAVSWFMNILSVLRMKPSDFFTELMDSKMIDFDFSFEEIINIQKEFLYKILSKLSLLKYQDLIFDLIDFNASISLLISDGKESIKKLNYHPDDLASEYSCDLQFFYKNCKKFPCRVKFFRNKNSIDWKIIK